MPINIVDEKIMDRLSFVCMYYLSSAVNFAICYFLNYDNSSTWFLLGNVIGPTIYPVLLSGGDFGKRLSTSDISKLLFRYLPIILFCVSSEVYLLITLAPTALEITNWMNYSLLLFFSQGMMFVLMLFAYNAIVRSMSNVYE
jgi:hypothetical protein